MWNCRTLVLASVYCREWRRHLCLYSKTLEFVGTIWISAWRHTFTCLALQLLSRFQKVTQFHYFINHFPSDKPALSPVHYSCDHLLSSTCLLSQFFWNISRVVVVMVVVVVVVVTYCSCYILSVTWTVNLWELKVLNLLTPNINYSGRTAPLTSKVAFYIFIQQI